MESITHGMPHQGRFLCCLGFSSFFLESVFFSKDGKKGAGEVLSLPAGRFVRIGISAASGQSGRALVGALVVCGDVGMETIWACCEPIRSDVLSERPFGILNRGQWCQLLDRERAVSPGVRLDVSSLFSPKTELVGERRVGRFTILSPFGFGVSFFRSSSGSSPVAMYRGVVSDRL